MRSLKNALKKVLKFIWDNAYSIFTVGLLCFVIEIMVIVLCVITYPVCL